MCYYPIPSRMVFPWILRIIIPVEPILFFHIVGFGPKIILPKLGKQYASDRRLTEMLSEQADLENDLFIILAGQEYIKPIRTYIKNVDDKLKGMYYGKRISYLKSQLP